MELCRPCEPVNIRSRWHPGRFRWLFPFRPRMLQRRWALQTVSKRGNWSAQRWQSGQGQVEAGTLRERRGRIRMDRCRHTAGRARARVAHLCPGGCGDERDVPPGWQCSTVRCHALGQGSRGRRARAPHILRRGLSRRPAHANGHGDRDRRMHRSHHREERDGPAAPRAASFFRPVSLTHAGEEHQDRGRPCRPALQLEREATRSHAAAAGAIRRTRRPRSASCQGCRRSFWPRWSAPRDRVSTSS